jgi:hypothetical protein
MQNKLSEGKLLNKSGNLCEAGYATSLVKEYNRADIKAKKLRIKEWDYYYVGNSSYGVALTIADNSYMGLCSLSFLDFKKPSQITKSVMKWFTKGKLALPSSSKEGDVFFKSKKVEMSFRHENNKRHLSCLWKEFTKSKKDLRLDLYLEETNKDSIVVATPFKKDKHFYYNQKINLLKCNGYVKLGEEILDFNQNTYGVLDWGRGVWTYKNTWYWSSMSGEFEGKKIGFNLGYGFGDTSTHSENIFFFENKSHKLEDVKFDIPINKNGNDSYLEPWKFRSNSGDINLTFTPIINRHANMNVGIIKSLQNQVFGKFSGYIIVDGKEYFFTDMLGFAEKVTNKW